MSDDYDIEDELERRSNGKLMAILSLKHPDLAECKVRADAERRPMVFVYAECGDCCGWRPTYLSNMREGEENPGVYYYGEAGFNLAGEMVVRMANDFTCAEGL